MCVIALVATLLLAAAPGMATADAELPRFGEFVRVESLPRPLHREAPRYPDDARRAGVSGTVLIQALVDRDGRVRDIRVTHSIPVLDAAAKTAVSRWRFKPAMSQGEPVAVWVAVPVKFSLR